MSRIGRPIRVLIVDDSALIRQVLSELLGSDPDIDVVGTAADPLIARERIKALNPDVITLDIEMPKMDGLAFLQKIMALRPTRVVMVSSLTQAGADTALQALELGAIDYVGKPLVDLRRGLGEMRAELVDKVKAAAAARLPAPPSGGRRDVRLAPGPAYSSAGRIVAVGASTGGVEALHELLGALPADCPGVLVTQHMPPLFTATFAARLDRSCAMAVAEAKDGERVLPGHVYIAPGDRHLELARSGGQYECRVRGGDLVSGHRPSVDVLFASVARSAGKQAIGVILTGMGRDGAAGLLDMRKQGAPTIAEAESSCVVYGMPKAAVQIGAVAEELPLSKIARGILDLCNAS